MVIFITLHHLDVPHAPPSLARTHLIQAGIGGRFDPGHKGHGGVLGHLRLIILAFMLEFHDGCAIKQERRLFLRVIPLTIQGEVGSVENDVWEGAK